MHRVHLANEKSFDGTASMSVLDAALQAGLVLEHSCRTGRCGTCKARVLEGDVVELKADLALSAEEREAGWMLTCANGAASDLQLDVEDLGLPADLRSRTLPCRIDSLDRPAPDILIVRLRLPPNSDFRYLAGQYIDVIGPGGVRRSYSIANDADGSGRIELHIRRVDSGVLSKYWFEQARSNDLLRLHGPLGTFFLRDVSGLDLVLMATGTGIAPVKALLEGLALRPTLAQPRSLSLLWGNRTTSDMYWSPDTLHPQSADHSFTYLPVLSRADPAWQGARGHVQDVFLRTNQTLADTAVYACGSPAMIDSALRDFTRAGLPRHRYFSDAFVSSD